MTSAKLLKLLNLVIYLCAIEAFMITINCLTNDCQG